MADPTFPDTGREPAAIACAVLACLLALPIVWTPSGLVDEVTLLSDGMRMASGQVPYRDFFSFLGPLCSGIPALVVLVAGPSVAALRVLTALVLGLAAWLLYQLARGLGARPLLAMLPGLTLAGVLYAAVPGYSHHWIPVAFLWGAVLAASRGAWFGAGLGIGLAGLVIQLDGVVYGAAIAAWIALDVLFGPSDPRTAARRLGALAAGALAPVAAACLYLAANGALGAAYQHVWVWTLSHYKVAGGVNDVKFPMDLAYVLSTQKPGFKLSVWYLNAGLVLTAYALPVGAAIATLARAADLALARLRGAGPWSPQTGRLALAGLLALASFAALLRGKADMIHVFYNLAPAVLFATAMAARWEALLAGPGRAAVAALPALGLAGFLALGVAHAGAAMAVDPLMRPTAGGPDAAMAKDPAAVWLRAHAAPGDRLAVFPLGPQWHVYALPPATRFTTMLHPAERYYDQADWDRFWAEIAANRPRFVMLAPIGRKAGPPDVPLPPGYAPAATLDLDYMGAPSRAYIYERAAARP